MFTVPALVTSAWTTLQPLLPVIAAKGAEEIGKRAVGEVWEAIKKKFDTKAAAKEALSDLLKAPEDADLQAAFRVQLKKLLEEDSAFAEEISRLLKPVAEGGYSAQLHGDGALAQGQDAKAVGVGGMMIGGNVSGGIHQGEKKDKQ
jgi:hypothetical protein